MSTNRVDSSTVYFFRRRTDSSFFFFKQRFLPFRCEDKASWCTVRFSTRTSRTSNDRWPLARTPSLTTHTWWRSRLFPGQKDTPVSILVRRNRKRSVCKFTPNRDFSGRLLEKVSLYLMPNQSRIKFYCDIYGYRIKLLNFTILIDGLCLPFEWQSIPSRFSYLINL